METLWVRFDEVPETLEEHLARVKQVERLRALFRQALIADSPMVFEATVVQVLTGKGSDIAAHDGASTTAR